MVVAEQLWEVLASLLNHFGVEEKIERFLPNDEAKRLRSAFLVKTDPASLMPSPDKVVQRIHYSWVLTFLHNQPEDLQQLLLQTLPPDMASAIANLLKRPLISRELPQEVGQFLLQQLCQKVGLADALPETFIPPGELNTLLELHKRQLATLISYLGLHDLAGELRQIVEQVTLTQIEQLLLPAQVAYLKQAMRQADPWKIAPAGVNQWARDKHHCYRLLQMRGLLRLGKALASASPILTWHLGHRLDTGRGRLLCTYAAKPAAPDLEKHLKQQVLRLVTQMRVKQTGE